MHTLIFNKILKKVDTFIERIKVKLHSINKIWRINEFFLHELAENNKIRLQISEQFEFAFDWPKTNFTQSELLLCIIEHIRNNIILKENNYLSIEAALLLILQRFALIIKPNTILTIYMVCSPFFEFERLANLPLMEVCAKHQKKHKFININIFDIDYYLYQIDNNGFKFVNDSPILSYYTVFGEFENVRIQDLIQYFTQLKVFNFFHNFSYITYI